MNQIREWWSGLQKRRGIRRIRLHMGALGFPLGDFSDEQICAAVVEFGKIAAKSGATQREIEEMAKTVAETGISADKLTNTIRLRRTAT